MTFVSARADTLALTLLPDNIVSSGGLGCGPSPTSHPSNSWTVLSSHPTSRLASSPFRIYLEHKQSSSFFIVTVELFSILLKVRRFITHSSKVSSCSTAVFASVLLLSVWSICALDSRRSCHTLGHWWDRGRGRSFCSSQSETSSQLFTL